MCSTRVRYVSVRHVVGAFDAVVSRAMSLRFFSVALVVGHMVSAPALAVDFNRDIRPILSNNCFACHGPDENERQADLRFDVEGQAGDVFKDGSESDFMARITSSDPDEIMPPPESHKELKPEQIALLKQWVEEGAPYEMHWAYKPVVRPEVPLVDGKSPEHAIDGFVSAQLVAQGMAPAPQTDKITLARRLHFDLIGLPPTPEQVAEFVNDASDEAYENMVKRLLASPQFGERLAVFWLDLVRYADTTGYHSDNHMEVSAYRRWVIDAFNDNKPYDEFTIEQLAGDLLPDASVQQKIASGYNRLLQTTEEGGAQAAEYMAIYAADRVRNVSGVWMGSTLGCAQCHDHKYDPFTAKDFYSMAAFFADIKEKAVGKRQPNLKIPSKQHAAELATMRKQLAENQLDAVLKSHPDLAPQLKQAQHEWEATSLAAAISGRTAWSVADVKQAKATDGIELKSQDDGSLLAAGKEPATSTFTIDLAAKGIVRSIRLEALTDASFKRKGGLSRDNGNFVLTDVKVHVGDKEQKIATATADFSQNGHEVARAIDGDAKSGWAVDGHNKTENRVAVFALAKPIDAGDGTEIKVTLAHNSQYGKHEIGRLRLALSATETTVSGGGLPGNILAALQTPFADRNEEQLKTLSDHYRDLATALQPYKKNRETAQNRINEIEKNARTMLISESMNEPRMTRILKRGDWMDKDGEVVEPAVPEFLPHEPIDGRRANRLDLAHWIVDPANPLTSRAFTNRLWALLYGNGLSQNLDDVGGQGEPPTHPQLLDWLAVEFLESGWDIKHMVTLLVSSDSYKKSSLAINEKAVADSTNRSLSRQGRWRVDAEFVRDAALHLSGLLHKDKLGGKSVKPYQPPGYWQHLNFPQRKWQADADEKLYRRSLYTYWCRSFLHPSLLAFDAPSREECTAKRARSNIPQQALVLLNDPIYLESSRVFAERIAQQEGDAAARIAWAWEQAVSRKPTDREAQLLLKLFQSQQRRYSGEEEDAKKLVEVGASAVAEDVPVSELAAWTQVSRAIINAYETTSRN